MWKLDLPFSVLNFLGLNIRLFKGIYPLKIWDLGLFEALSPNFFLNKGGRSGAPSQIPTRKGSKNMHPEPYSISHWGPIGPNGCPKLKERKP